MSFRFVSKGNQSGRRKAIPLQKQRHGLHPLIRSFNFSKRRVIRLFYAYSKPANSTMGQPGDRYERVAEGVADQIVRIPDPAFTHEREQGSNLDGRHS